MRPPLPPPAGRPPRRRAAFAHCCLSIKISLYYRSRNIRRHCAAVPLPACHTHIHIHIHPPLYIATAAAPARARLRSLGVSSLRPYHSHSPVHERVPPPRLPVSIRPPRPRDPTFEFRIMLCPPLHLHRPFGINHVFSGAPVRRPCPFRRPTAYIITRSRVGCVRGSPCFFLIRLSFPVFVRGVLFLE